MGNMKMYDVTLPIYEGMPVYKNKEEKQPEIKTLADHQSGHVYESRLCMDAHTGTHIDAPLHMIKDGNTIESIAIEDLVTDVHVFDLTHLKTNITEKDLQPLNINEGDFILFKTKNSFDKAFNFDFIYLEESGAKYLAEKRVKGVGIDGLGVERSQPDHPTHKQLFNSNIIIIEGLKLDEIEPGIYHMVAAPLKLAGIDAAPAGFSYLKNKNSVYIKRAWTVQAPFSNNFIFSQ